MGRSGRKKTKYTIAAEKAREYLVNTIAEHLTPIMSAQINATKGLFYIGKEGKVYSRLPDTKVGEYLLNQVAGKAKEKVEVSSDDKPYVIILDRQKQLKSECFYIRI